MFTVAQFTLNGASVRVTHNPEKDFPFIVEGKTVGRYAKIDAYSEPGYALKRATEEFRRLAHLD